MATAGGTIMNFALLYKSDYKNVCISDYTLRRITHCYTKKVTDTEVMHVNP